MLAGIVKDIRLFMTKRNILKNEMPAPMPEKPDYGSTRGTEIASFADFSTFWIVFCSKKIVVAGPLS